MSCDCGDLDCIDCLMIPDLGGNPILRSPKGSLIVGRPSISPPDPATMQELEHLALPYVPDAEKLFREKRENAKTSIGVWLELVD